MKPVEDRDGLLLDDVDDDVATAWNDVIVLRYPPNNGSDGNTTVPTGGSIQPDPVMARVQLAILAAMLTVSLIGNGLALLALKLRLRKLTRMHFFFVHLCVADLVVAVFHILLQLVLDASGGFGRDRDDGDLVASRALCKVIRYLQMLGPYSSAYVLAATAIDRYQAICFPLSNCSWTPRRSQVMVSVAWLLAATFDLPQVFVFDYYYGEYRRYDCYASFAHAWGERLYVLWVTLAIFIMPFVIIVYTYTCICRVIWINFRQKSHDGDEGRTLRRTTSRGQVNGNVVVVGSAYRFKVKGKGCCKVEVRAPAHTLAPAGHSNGMTPRTHSTTGISRAKMKTIKMTVVVIVCYVACYSPFYCSMLYVTWYPGARHFAFYNSPTFAIVALLASLNSCVNPWLYLSFNENLTKTLKDLFCCRPRVTGGESGATGIAGVGGLEARQAAFSRSSISESKSCTGGGNGGPNGSPSIGARAHDQRQLIARYQHHGHRKTSAVDLLDPQTAVAVHDGDQVQCCSRRPSAVDADADLMDSSSTASIRIDVM